MRVLIAPMAAMAETSGPFSRAAALAKKLVEQQHEVALCSAEDVNYHKIADITNYYAPIPSPLGLPMFIGRRIFKMSQLLGIQQKRKVNSFEELLHFVGATSKEHFKSDIVCLRRAIKDFKPDVVYAEFRLSAIVAAKLENVRVVTGYSYPVQWSFASNPRYSKGVRSFLKERGLPDIESTLELFDWADLKIVPSSFELEPIKGDNVIFTGPFTIPENKTIGAKKNKIIAYMGNGTITPRVLVDELTKAFDKTEYEVYIASVQLEPFVNNNIHVDKRFDFSKLMPEAVAFINHGGQNSIMTGLLYGVPQLICAGNVFERRYNASSITRLKAGISLETEEFKADLIRSIVSKFETVEIYAKNSRAQGEMLFELGGVAKAVKTLEKIVSKVSNEN